MNKILKDTLILTAITLVAGSCLGFVYEITKKPIADAQYQAQQDAYKEVFQEAENFEALEGFDEESANVLVAEAGYGGDLIKGVVSATDDTGNVLGYVLTVSSKEGYAGEIKFSMGVQIDGTLNGISILSISETAGLGMKATDQAFKGQYEQKKVESFETVKSEASNESQIQAISGATITSAAITNGVNAGLVYFNSMVEGGSTNE